MQGSVFAVNWFESRIPGTLPGMKVVVIDVSRLHLGYVGCYGNEWIATPNLDRLAAEGVVFDQHYADDPGGRGAERTCWTGRHRFPFPGEVGDRPAEALPSLVQLLEEQGMPFALVAPSPADESTGDDPSSALERTLPCAVAAVDRLADREHWLVWVDLPPLVPPWHIPEDFLRQYFAGETDAEEPPLEPWPDPGPGPLDGEDDVVHERLQNTYAAAVTYLDDQLGVLLDDLEQRGLAEELLVCVTADRGLALGEHGIVGDGRPWPHEEVIHLPLILRLPGAAEAGRRVFALTQPVDLLPTFLEAFGLPVPPWTHGHSLWPLLRGAAEQMRSYACAGMRVGDAIEWALRTPDWGFILPEATEADPAPRRPQLYVKPDDRWEVNNVLQHHLDLADHLEQTLRGFVQATRRPGPLQAPELREEEMEMAQAEDSSDPGGEA
jgi:arylsulfatase A-like enzyme